MQYGIAWPTSTTFPGSDAADRRPRSSPSLPTVKVAALPKLISAATKQNAILLSRRAARLAVD